MTDHSGATVNEQPKPTTPDNVAESTKLASQRAIRTVNAIGDVAERVATTTRLLSELREGAGLEQQAVAAQLGVSPSVLSRFENNHHTYPHLALFFAVCDELNVRPSAVLRLAEDAFYPLDAPWTVAPQQLLDAYTAQSRQALMAGAPQGYRIVSGPVGVGTVVTAVQHTGTPDNLDTIRRMLGLDAFSLGAPLPALHIGGELVDVGDWIVHAHGLTEVVDADRFAAHYRPVDAGDES